MRGSVVDCLQVKKLTVGPRANSIPSLVVIARSNAIAPDPRVERAASCLASVGFRVLLIGWDRERKFPDLESNGSLTIRRVRYRGCYGGGLKNFMGLAAFNLALVKLILKHRPRVIHGTDLDTAIPALVAKWLLGTRFVYDIADWYSASRRVGFLTPLFDFVERWAVRHADYVIVAHEARITQLGGEPPRWTAIYNSPEDITPNSSEPGGAIPYFSYVGVLQEDRGLDDIIEAATRARATIVVAGYGPLAARCAAAAKDNEHVQFLGQVPYQQALAIQRGSVAVLALYDPRVPNNRLAAPNKLYEAMMLGKPIITSAGTLAAELVEQEKLGLVVRFGNQQDIVQAIRFLLHHPEAVQEMGQGPVGYTRNTTVVRHSVGNCWRSIEL